MLGWAERYAAVRSAPGEARYRSGQRTLATSQEDGCPGVGYHHRQGNRPCRSGPPSLPGGAPSALPDPLLAQLRRTARGGSPGAAGQHRAARPEGEATQEASGPTGAGVFCAVPSRSARHDTLSCGTVCAPAIRRGITRPQCTIRRRIVLLTITYDPTSPANDKERRPSGFGPASRGAGDRPHALRGRSPPGTG